MATQYWLHRISAGWEASYPLLDMGYLSIGWSYYTETGLWQQVQGGGKAEFRRFTLEHGDTSNSRWQLWNFFQFQPGDKAVVPLFGKMFTVVEITDTPFPVGELAGLRFTAQNGDTAEIRGNGVWNTVGDWRYDIGFLVKARRALAENLSRSHAPAVLLSKMHYQGTNCHLNDAAESVENVIRTNLRPPEDETLEFITIHDKE